MVAEIMTFQNGAEAFVSNPNLIKLYQKNSGNIVNMNIKGILF